MIKFIFLICIIFFQCNSTDYPKEVCVKGKMYYDFGRGLAIKLNNDGKPIRCNE